MLNISFFSYKGGAGRTSLLYNTLPFLAEALRATPEEPIVVIDLDIDSKGMTYLIDRECDYNAVQVLKGEIPHNRRTDFAIKSHPFLSKLIPIGEDVGLSADMNGAILFIPAPSDDSFLGANNADGQNISLNKIREICTALRCKALVMDTPTGSQLSGECALSISNKIVTTMRITTQFHKGTCEFFRKKAVGYSQKEFIVVPNAVPYSPMDENGNARYDIEKLMRRISKNLSDTLIGSENRLNLSLLENGNYGIREVASFKFEELNLKRIQKKRQLVDDERLAIKMYEMLAEELVR